MSKDDDMMAAIDRLATLVPGGQLASTMGPVAFLDHVAEHVRKLTDENKQLRYPKLGVVGVGMLCPECHCRSGHALTCSRCPT